MILRRAVNIAIVLVYVGGVSSIATSQTAPAQREIQQRDTRSERQRDSQTEKEKPIIVTAPEADSSQTELKQAIIDLMEQVKALNLEVGRLRRANERDSASLELVLSEDRVSRLEERLAELQERKQQLDAREQDLQNRIRNPQQDLLARGGLRREEATAAVRADLQTALEEVRRQQAALQSRTAEVQTQYDRLRRRVEELLKKVPLPEEKPNQQNQ